MVNEVFSSSGASGVRYSQDYIRELVQNVMDKYKVSQDQAREIVARSYMTPRYTRESVDAFARSKLQRRGGI